MTIQAVAAQCLPDMQYCDSQRCSAKRECFVLHEKQVPALMFALSVDSTRVPYTVTTASFYAIASVCVRPLSVSSR
jgi:hypothetical protein